MIRYVIFALIGPLVGGFILLAVGTPAGYWGKPYSDDFAKLFKVLFSTLQYNYLFGLLPALMMGAVDDILAHVKRIGPAVRMVLTGAAAFIVAALLYGGSQPYLNFVQSLGYGLVGLIPAMLSSWLSHKMMERQGVQSTA